MLWRFDTDKFYNFDEFMERYITPFQGVEYIYDEKRGYVVWRASSGWNIEFLHLRAFKTGKGIGPQLIREMLLKLRTHKRFDTIFAFLRDTNEPMKKVCRKMGFTLYEGLENIYAGEKACLICGRYEEIMEKNFELLDWPNKELQGL